MKKQGICSTRGHNKQTCSARKQATQTEATTDPLDNSFQHIKLPPSDLTRFRPFSGDFK
jgi:hypothetical protein